MRRFMLRVICVCCIVLAYCHPLTVPPLTTKPDVGVALAAAPPIPTWIRRDHYRYLGHNFYVVTFPTQTGPIPIPYEPRNKQGQRVRQSLSAIKHATGARIVTSGGYFHPRSGKPVDFLSIHGQEIQSKQIGRAFVYLLDSGNYGISHNYAQFRHDPHLVAMAACAERLCPVRYDRLDANVPNCYIGNKRLRALRRRELVLTSRAVFAADEDARYSIGFSSKTIRDPATSQPVSFQLTRIVYSPKCDLYLLSRFMTDKLFCEEGLNLDGGSSTQSTNQALLWRNRSDPQCAAFLSREFRPG